MSHPVQEHHGKRESSLFRLTNGLCDIERCLLRVQVEMFAFFAAFPTRTSNSQHESSRTLFSSQPTKRYSAKQETTGSASVRAPSVSKRRFSVQTFVEKGRFANAVDLIGHKPDCKRVVFLSLNDVTCARYTTRASGVPRFRLTRMKVITDETLLQASHNKEASLRHC